MSANKRRRGGHRPSDASFSSHPQPLPSASDRKLRQLCRQIHERVDLVLAGEISDPNLDGLWVVDVQPEPGGAAMLVTVVAPDHAELAPIRASLDRARGHIRAEVSAAITRKRTPHLRFAVIPERALRATGGDGD